MKSFFLSFLLYAAIASVTSAAGMPDAKGAIADQCKSLAADDVPYVDLTYWHRALSTCDSYLKSAPPIDRSALFL